MNFRTLRASDFYLARKNAADIQQIVFAFWTPVLFVYFTFADTYSLIEMIGIWLLPIFVISEVWELGSLVYKARKYK